MDKTKEFFSCTMAQMKKTKEKQKNNILAAAKLMGDCMNNNGIVQLFGVKHAMALSMELGYRAGGLMPFHQMNLKDLAMRKIVSEEEYHSEEFYNDSLVAEKLWDIYLIDPNDIFIITDYEANNPIAVELAIIAKEKNHKVIAVINKALSDESASNHPDGKKLSAIADIVIDLEIDNPDLVIYVTDDFKVCQMATITGNMIAQMLTAEVYRYLTDKGIKCPILLSSNVSGADVHNRELSDKYLGRWNS